MNKWKGNEINYLALYLCIIFPTEISVERAIKAFERGKGLNLSTDYTVRQMVKIASTMKRANVIR